MEPIQIFFRLLQREDHSCNCGVTRQRFFPQPRFRHYGFRYLRKNV